MKQGRLKFAEISISKLSPVSVERPRILELPLPHFKTISKFPPLVRDVTIDQSTSSDFLDELKSFDRLLLAEAIDEYQGRLTYRLVFQNMNASFSEEEIKAIDSDLERFQKA